MAEQPPITDTTSPSFSTSPSPASTPSDSDTSHHSHYYWCYQCEKQVSVETLADLPDLICQECKNGFVESIPVTAAAPPSRRASDAFDETSFGDQFLQVLRLISQVAREDDAPPPPPPEHADAADPDPSDDDYLRIELEGLDNDDDDDDDDDRDDLSDVDDDGEEENEEQEQHLAADDARSRSDAENENRGEERDEEDDLRRRRRDVLRLRMRDFAARAANRRNRILDWAEILMGLEDQSIELRLRLPEMEMEMEMEDDYIGNPGDYVDAAGYETLLQTLAESDSNGRRGAPPASKLAISALETVEIKSENETVMCAICKDRVSVGEFAKNLPCGHKYHGDCIVPWLGSRNSCPVCRFELPTDDPDYEEQRSKRSSMPTTLSNSAPSSSSTG